MFATGNKPQQAKQADTCKYLAVSHIIITHNNITITHTMRKRRLNLLLDEIHCRIISIDDELLTLVKAVNESTVNTSFARIRRRAEQLGNEAGVLGARARKLYIAATGVVPDNQDLGLVGVFESLDFLLHE